MISSTPLPEVIGTPFQAFGLDGLWPNITTCLTRIFSSKYLLFDIPGLSDIKMTTALYLSGMEHGEDRLFITDDGSHSIQSAKFGVSYHSRHGALQETQYVFIDRGLRARSALQSKVHVLEIGFGTGLNAYMSWHYARKRGVIVQYTGLEAYPISPDLALQCNYEEQLRLHEQEEEYVPPFMALHEQEWGNALWLDPHFQLLKKKILFEDFSSSPKYDVIYYDAFAPNAQAHLWEEPILQRMYDALLPDGFLVTYCAKGVFKRRLKKVGFKVEALPGPPGKREMTRAVKIIAETPSS